MHIASKKKRWKKATNTTTSTAASTQTHFTLATLWHVCDGRYQSSWQNTKTQVAIKAPRVLSFCLQTFLLLQAGKRTKKKNRNVQTQRLNMWLTTKHKCIMKSNAALYILPVRNGIGGKGACSSNPRQLCGHFKRKAMLLRRNEQ